MGGAKAVAEALCVFEEQLSPLGLVEHVDVAVAADWSGGESIQGILAI